MSEKPEEKPVDPFLEAWLTWAEACRTAGDPQGATVAGLLAGGFDGCITVLGRPDAAPLVKCLLLELGPLPIWVRPAVPGSARRPPLDLLREALFHLVEVALPGVLASQGLSALPSVLSPEVTVDEARAAGTAVGALAREALEQRGDGALETAARLLDGALGHYVRYRVGSEAAARDAMALAAAAARAMERMVSGTRMALVRAVLRDAGPWAALGAALEASA